MKISMVVVLMAPAFDCVVCVGAYGSLPIRRPQYRRRERCRLNPIGAKHAVS